MGVPPPEYGTSQEMQKRPNLDSRVTWENTNQEEVGGDAPFWELANETEQTGPKRETRVDKGGQKQPAEIRTQYPIPNTNASEAPNRNALIRTNTGSPSQLINTDLDAGISDITARVLWKVGTFPKPPGPKPLRNGVDNSGSSHSGLFSEESTLSRNLILPTAPANNGDAWSDSNQPTYAVGHIPRDKYSVLFSTLSCSLLFRARNHICVYDTTLIYLTLLRTPTSLTFALAVRFPTAILALSPLQASPTLQLHLWTFTVYPHTGRIPHGGIISSYLEQTLPKNRPQPTIQETPETAARQPHRFPGNYLSKEKDILGHSLFLLLLLLNKVAASSATHLLYMASPALFRSLSLHRLHSLALLYLPCSFHSCVADIISDWLKSKQSTVTVKGSDNHRSKESHLSPTRPNRRQPISSVALSHALSSQADQEASISSAKYGSNTKKSAHHLFLVLDPSLLFLSTRAPFHHHHHYHHHHYPHAHLYFLLVQRQASGGKPSQSVVLVTSRKEQQLPCKVGRLTWVNITHHPYSSVSQHPCPITAPHMSCSITQAHLEVLNHKLSCPILANPACCEPLHDPLSLGLDHPSLEACFTPGRVPFLFPEQTQKTLHLRHQPKITSPTRALPFRSPTALSPSVPVPDSSFPPNLPYLTHLKVPQVQGTWVPLASSPALALGVWHRSPAWAFLSTPPMYEVRIIVHFNKYLTLHTSFSPEAPTPTSYSYLLSLTRSPHRTACAPHYKPPTPRQRISIATCQDSTLSFFFSFSSSSFTSLQDSTNTWSSIACLRFCEPTGSDFLLIFIHFLFRAHTHTHLLTAFRLATIYDAGFPYLGRHPRTFHITLVDARVTTVLCAVDQHYIFPAFSLLLGGVQNCLRLKTARSEPRSTFDLRNLTIIFGRNADESTHYSSNLSGSNFLESFQHNSAACNYAS
ncbi:uncharacterized protein CLUP02_12504 [Colletotrichum lupini]|uniref:Uncharacterized protein n=1 Tax=Colletotrichum lupini TaxID=145971 RepID=A0A9Q8T2C7_9PEZI|nr:uncharacterized protein CLUP02_12504 [Colletotrichum lupini]UQC87002.1 hypothetical protein CLUP02_12504 [Colletotrichum lupini]